MVTDMIFFVTLFACVNLQVISFDNCPDIKTVQDFEVDKYLGRWYEQRKYPSLFEAYSRCVTTEYYYGDDGQIRILNRKISTQSGYPKTTEGIASNTSATEGKFIVKFSSVHDEIAIPYWIIGTDYVNYAVVWSCYDAGLFTLRGSWLLTRIHNPSERIMHLADDAVQTVKIDSSYFSSTDQLNCTYQ